MNKPIDNRGFTLIEIMVAVFLLVTALLSLISTTVIVIKSNSLGNTMTTATTLAGDKMEQFKNTNYSDLAGGTGIDYADIESTVQGTSTAETVFTRTWNITCQNVNYATVSCSQAVLKTIIVTVQWNWQGASRNVSLTSLVAN
jgi:Tfp pilus assembly protein PilV